MPDNHHGRSCGHDRVYHLGPYAETFYILHMHHGPFACTLRFRTTRQLMELDRSEREADHVTLVKLARYHHGTVRHRHLSDGTCLFEVQQGPRIDVEKNAGPAEVPEPLPAPPPPPDTCTGRCPDFEISCPPATKPNCEGGDGILTCE